MAIFKTLMLLIRLLRFPLKCLVKIFMVVLLLLAGIPGFSQSLCRLNYAPKSPFPNKLDTLCVGDPNFLIYTFLPVDSSNHAIKWFAGDTMSTSLLPSNYTVNISPGNQLFYYRFTRTSASGTICNSYFQSLTFIILPNLAPIPSLKVYPLYPANRILNVCEGYTLNLADSLVSPSPYTFRWYAFDSLGNKIPFNGIYSNAKYTSFDTTFYVQAGGIGSCFGTPFPLKVYVLPKPLLKVTSQSPVLNNVVCDSLDIPFKANIRYAGNNPTFDWFVNGVQVTSKSKNPTYTIKAGTFHPGDPVKVYYVIHIDQDAPYYHCDSIGPPFGSDTVPVEIRARAKLPGQIQGPTIVYEGQQNAFYQVQFDTTLLYTWRFANPNDAKLHFAQSTATLSISDSLKFLNNRVIVDTLTLVVQNNCDSVKESVLIFIRPVLKPINILTPNGDNINDTWIINNIENEAYTKNEVTIYDRFGNKVYQQQNYTNTASWDGTYHGKALSEGTYYYLIQYYEGTLTKYLKGYITILRGR